jgi:biopolymer transport protein ExbB
MAWIQPVIDYGILGILVVMSIIAVAIAIERYLSYRDIRLQDYPDRTTLEITLTQRLHLIAAIGSNAPYIGLLGTVLGIMATFYIIGAEGYMDTGKIMVGLAMALKATAVGLGVAIPAIVLYNLLLRRVRVLVANWEIAHGRKGI